MTLNEIFPDEAEFMDWLANNCYSCAKLNDDTTEYNYACELENIISHFNLNKEIDDKLTRLITEKGKLCRCKNFISPASRSPPLSMNLVEQNLKNTVKSNKLHQIKRRLQMSKVKYSKHQKEILEMYYNGKNAVEIAENINAKYGIGSFVRGAIQMQMNKGKQDENEQTKMFSKNQERVQDGENSAQKATEKQEITQENPEAKKMNESDKVLIKVIESFSRLEEEFHKAFVTSIILNDELGRAIDALKEKRRKNKIKYLLFGGSFLVAMIFGILLGCHDAHTGASMPIFSFDYIKDIWAGVLVGLGLMLLLDIAIIIRYKREHN